MNKQVTHIRFPNESYYDKVSTFKVEDFKLIDSFQNEIYGIWNDTHVFIMKEDYNKLLEDETKG
jgi:hypothetical protein